MFIVFILEHNLALLYLYYYVLELLVMLKLIFIFYLHYFIEDLSTVADPGFYFNGVHFRVGPCSGRVKVRFELDLKKIRKIGLSRIEPITFWWKRERFTTTPAFFLFLWCPPNCIYGVHIQFNILNLLFFFKKIGVWGPRWH
ncbi:hypothetical protein Hdeb2414_s0340g00871951 [Helianthus debilis subsp. tardiflorus]